MDTRKIAQALGSLGGKARARALSPAERRRIAALGGLARSLSRHAERRVADNFHYLRAVQELQRAAASHGR